MDEVKACLSLIFYAGVDCHNFTAVDDLLSPVNDKPIYRAVMSQNRFKFFLRTVRFDNYRDRQNLLSQNRFVAI